MKTLVDTILEAVAKGCSVEMRGATIRGNHKVVIVDARTTRGDFSYTCLREVAGFAINQSAIGADALLADVVRSATSALLNAAAKGKGQ